MGIILGALGGAGEAAREIGANMQSGAIQADLENLRSQNEIARARAVEELKMQVGNQQRDQVLARRDAAKQSIINSAIEDKYAGAKPADPSTWTAEQQAAVDQSKGIDRKEMEADVNTDLRAAMQTGEISPKDVAVLEQRNAANDTKMAIAELRNEAFRARTDAQLQTAMAKMEIAIARAGSSGGGNTDFDKKIKLLKESGATPQDIANFIIERKQPSLEDLAANFLKSDPMAGTSKAMTPQKAYEKAKALRSLTKSLGDDDEPAAPSAPAAKPAAPAKRLSFDPVTGTFK
jgi:hypothetical protein